MSGDEIRQLYFGWEMNMLIPMIIIKRLLIVSCIIIIVFLAGGCGNVTPFPTATEVAVSNPVSTTPSIIPSPFLTTTSSPQITTQFAITANPDQVARWKEYEYALASKILYTHPPEEILCEWEILGQSELVVYVWAFCLGLSPAGKGEEYAPRANIPAVIHLGSDGSVQNVEIPGYSASYAEGVRKLFPLDIQEKIFNRLIDYAELTNHAKARRENPDLPLIVLLTTPQP